MAWQWLISGFGEVPPTLGAKGYAVSGLDNGRVYSEAVACNLRYPGRHWDEETGLSYNLHRYYDAQTGRYIQADPIGLRGGNRFGYVGGIRWGSLIRLDFSTIDVLPVQDGRTGRNLCSRSELCNCRMCGGVATTAK